MQIVRLTTLGFSSLTSEVTFSRFRSSFLSDLYCGHSQVQLVAKINWLQQSKEEVLMAHLEVLGGTDLVVNGSNPVGGKVFLRT